MSNLQSNSVLISSVFTDEQFDNIAFYASKIEEDYSLGLDLEPIYRLGDGKVITNLRKKSETQVMGAVMSPKRFQTPFLTFSEKEISANPSKDVIDSYERPLLKSTISSLTKSLQAANNTPILPVKPNLFALGFSSIVSILTDPSLAKPFQSITIVESDLEMAALVLSKFSLHEFWEYLKTNSIGLSIIYGPTYDDIVAGIQKHILRNEPTSILNIVVLNSSFNGSALTKINGWIESSQGLACVVPFLFGNETDEINQFVNARLNILQATNSTTILSNSSTKSIQDCVILVASGPSLDNQLKNLKKLSSLYSIVACGSSLGTLLKNKIKVSAYVNLEMESLVYDDLYKLCNEGYSFSGIKLITSLSCDPRLSTLFDSTVYFARNLAYHSLLSESFRQSMLLQGGPQVANAGLEVLLKLGYKKIYIIGCDFSAPSDMKSARSKDAIGIDERKLTIPMSSNRNNTVMTEESLILTAQFFSDALGFYGAQAFNPCEGLKMSHTQIIDEIPETGLQSRESFDQILSDGTDVLLPEKALLYNNTHQTMLIAIKKLFKEIELVLSQSTVWDRATQRSFNHILTCNLKDEQARDRTFVVRLARSTLLFMLRYLAAEDVGYEQAKKSFMVSLESYKLHLYHVFETFNSLIVNYKSGDKRLDRDAVKEHF